VDEVTAAGRLSPLLDRMEARGREFHRKVRAGYQQQVAGDPAHYAMVDASGSPEQVWASLLETVRTRLTM
jgi:dTMP kinase